MRHIWILAVLLLATLACAITEKSDATPPDTFGEYGFVEVQGYTAVNQGGNYVLPVGETVTFIWRDLTNTNVIQAEFSYTAYDGGSLISLGIDDDLSDGAQVTWTVPTEIAGTVTASARVPGQSGEGIMSAGMGINSEDQAGAIRDQ